MAKARQHLSRKTKKRPPDRIAIAQSEWLRIALVMVLLSAAILFIYRRVMGYGFVLYDDPYYVTDNLFVKTGLNPQSIWWALTTNHYGGWHPVTWLSLMLDCQLFGLNPFAFHLVNVLLHVANTLLVFHLLKHTTGALWKSAFVAALFALHPLHVESVAWVTERKDVLSSFIWLLTMLAYVRYTEDPSFRRRILVPILLAVGLMAKPMLVSLPIILLLMDYWPLRRLSAENWKGLLREKAPLFALAAMSCVATLFAQRTGVASLVSIPLSARIENAVLAYGGYIYKTIWPAGLACIYPLCKQLPVWKSLISAAMIISVSVVVFRTRKKRPYLLSGWLWYLITLVPVIGLVQVGSQSMADRYTYIPLIGIFVMVTWAIGGIWNLLSSAWSRGVLAATALAVLISFSTLTWVQIGYWSDDLTLFGHALKVTQENWVAHDALGTYLGMKGNLKTALKHYESALRINPSSENTLNNVGFVLAQLGQTDKAIKHYRSALAIKPSDPRAHLNLGIALAKQNKLDDAISEYRTALDIDPSLLIARECLADALMISGDAYEAIKQYRQVIMWNRNNPRMHANLASALSALGRCDEAERELALAVRLEPANIEIRINHAIILKHNGKNLQAINELQAILRIHPESPNAHFLLASAYLSQGQYAAAWSEIHLCRRYGGNPDPGVVNAIAAGMPDPGI